MKGFAAFLLPFTILGAFAKPQPNAQPNRFISFNESISLDRERPLPVVNTHIQSPLSENPTIEFPNIIPRTTVSESRHYLKTLVRPQIHNEIITVPTIDHIVRTVTSPVVETITGDGSSRMVRFSRGDDILSVVAASRRPSEGKQNNGSTSCGSENGSNVNRRCTNQNSSVADIGFFSTPTFFKFQTTHKF